MTMDELNHELDLMNATVKGIACMFNGDFVDIKTLEDSRKIVKGIADQAYEDFLGADDMETIFDKLIQEKRFRIYDEFIELISLYMEREEKCGSMGGMNHD